MQQAAELLAPASILGPFGERPESPNTAAVEQARQFESVESVEPVKSVEPIESLRAPGAEPASMAGASKAPDVEPRDIEPGAALVAVPEQTPATPAPAPAPAVKKSGGGGGAPAPEAGAIDVDAPVLLDDGDADADADDQGPPDQIEAEETDVQDAEPDDGAPPGEDDAPADDAGDDDDLSDADDADPDADPDPRPVAEQLAAELPVAPDYAPSGGGGGAAIVDPPEPAPVEVAGDAPAAGLGKLTGKRADVVANALGGMGESVKAAVGQKRAALKAAPPTSKSLTGPKEAAQTPKGDAPLPDKAAPVEAGADVPTPEPQAVPAPSAPPAAERVKTPPIKGGRDGGKLDKADVAKMEAGLDALPTSDPALIIDVGPPPPVQLAGNADPVAAKKSKGQLDAQLAHLKQSGHRDVAANRPNESIPTEIPDTTLTATIPETSSEGGADLSSLQADGTLGKMAAEIEPDTIDTAIGKAQGDLAEKKKAQADEEQQLRLDAKNSVDKLHADAQADQKKQRAEAKKVIGQARAEWKKALDKTHSDAKFKADKELQAGLKAVSKKKADAENEAKNHLKEGDKKAAEARREGEKKAQAHKKNGKKQKKGFWGWLASKAKAFFDGIKKKITQAINWARKKVKQAIEWAKKAAKAAIEKARKWIVDKIKAVGDALKAIGDVVLAAYPELREKFRKAIDEKVAAATQAVNDAAKKLEKGVTAALDGLGKALDKGLALLEKGLHLIVDGVGAVVQGVIDNARKIAEALGTFAGLFVDVASDPLGWIKNLGAAVVSGLKNHFWGAFKTAVKAWFQSKLLEVLGIGGVIIKLLLSDGGLTMEKIGQMTWDALKAMIPAALIGILVTKLVSMIVPAAGAVIAIIEGLQAAWGTVSRIITAIDLFMKFLKAVKSGQAAKPFAEALAAAGVVVLDFVANWLLKKLGPIGRGIGKKFKKKAKGLKRKKGLKGKKGGIKGKGPKPKAQTIKGKPSKKTPPKTAKGKTKRDKTKDQALVKRAARTAAGKAWSLAKRKASKRVMKKSALEQALRAVEGRKGGVRIKADVMTSGKSWTVKATASKKGRTASSTKGRGSVLKSKQGATFYAATDIRPVEKRVEAMVRKTLKKAAKEKSKGKDPSAAIKGKLKSIEGRGQKMLNRKIKGVDLGLTLDSAKTKDGTTVVDAIIQPNYHEWEMVLEGKGLEMIAEAIRAKASKKDWLYNQGLQFLQSLEDKHAKEGVKMDFDYKRYPQGHGEVFKHGGDSQDVRQVIAKFTRGREKLNVVMNAIATPNRRKSGHEDPVAKGYGKDALTHRDRDRAETPNRHNTYPKEETRPHDAIPDTTWKATINKVAKDGSLKIPQGDPVVSGLLSSVGAKIQTLGGESMTSVVTGDGRSKSDIEKVHGDLSAHQRFVIAMGTAGSTISNSGGSASKDDFIGPDWKKVQGRGGEADKKRRIDQALRARIKLVMAQFRSVVLPSVTAQLLRDQELASIQRDPKKARDLERAAAPLRRLLRLPAETTIADLLEHLDREDALAKLPRSQSHVDKFKARMVTASTTPTVKTNKFLSKVSTEVLSDAKKDRR